MIIEDVLTQLCRMRHKVYRYVYISINFMPQVVKILEHTNEYLNSANPSDIPNDIKSPTEPLLLWSLYSISPCAISGMSTISMVKFRGSPVSCGRVK